MWSATFASTHLKKKSVLNFEKRETSISYPPTCASNLGMCPNQEWNVPPFDIEWDNVPMN